MRTSEKFIVNIILMVLWDWVTGAPQLDKDFQDGCLTLSWEWTVNTDWLLDQNWVWELTFTGNDKRFFLICQAVKHWAKCLTCFWERSPRENISFRNDEKKSTGSVLHGGEGSSPALVGVLHLGFICPTIEYCAIRMVSAVGARWQWWILREAPSDNAPL